NPIGSFTFNKNAVAINPGRHALGATTPSLMEFADGKIARIVSQRDRATLPRLELEPQLITNLSDARERRRLIRFNDIPPRLVHAAASLEDKRYFVHSGFDPLRMLKAAWIDVRSGSKRQGATTNTMQRARSFWLEAEKRWKRKIEELI